jgi:HlyD family secretion protein
MKKIKHFIKTKKILSFVIIIIVVFGGYYAYSKFAGVNAQTSYMLSRARIGNVATTISGTGQVYASSQLDIKSKASGNLVYLNTTANGQQIKKGDLIAKVDTRDASISLESAKIAYAKLVRPADAPTLLQAENNLTEAIQSNNKSYADGFSTVVNAFVDMPSIIAGLDNMLYSRDGYLQTENIRSIGETALDLQIKAGISYDRVKNHYNELLVQYKNISNTSASSTIESLVSTTYTLAKEISSVVKNAQSAVDYIKSQRNDSAGSTAQSSVASWTNTITSYTSNLLSAKNAITNSSQNITQQRLNLEKISQGATDLDIASQNLQLRQAENNFEDYFIRAPFDGVLARLSVKPTDIVSNGTVIGTVVSAQKILTITLNEVDVAKVRVGQKAKVSFDAVENLTVDGSVSTVDLVGTVSQGVVNYNVEIALDATDERIRSGMSASASIITESKDNVVLVPNSAVKTQRDMRGGVSFYVEVFSPPLPVNRSMSLASAGTVSATPPQRKVVEVGLVDDTNTEIITGLSDGDQIVTRTIAGATVTTARTTTNTAATRSATGATRGATGIFGGRPPGN